MFIPNPNFFIPDPDRNKEFKYFLPTKLFQALGKMIWDVHPGSGLFSIPDLLVKKAPDPEQLLSVKAMVHPAQYFSAASLLP